MEKKKNAAVIVAAGSGTRMGSDIPKQYMKIDGKPMLYYSVMAFEKSPMIDEIVVVVAPGEELRCYDEVIDRYHFRKVSSVTVGGDERYQSVYNGLMAVDPSCVYVFIHDGARPCVTRDIITRAYEEVQAYDACVVGMPVKDTIRRVRRNDDCVSEVLDRSEIWMMQTPQVFAYRLIAEAYEGYIASGASDATDDAMVLERMTAQQVRIVEGSYRNIKVTTPEDLSVAGVLLKK